MPAAEEGRNIAHNEAKAIQHGPSDNDSLEPCPAFIDGSAAAGEIHHQQCDCGRNDGCNRGDAEDLRIDIPHDLIGLLPHGCGRSRLTERRG